MNKEWSKKECAKKKYFMRESKIATCCFFVPRQGWRQHLSSSKNRDKRGQEWGSECHMTPLRGTLRTHPFSKEGNCLLSPTKILTKFVGNKSEDFASTYGIFDCQPFFRIECFITTCVDS